MGTRVREIKRRDKREGVLRNRLKGRYLKKRKREYNETGVACTYHINDKREVA